MTNQEQKTKWHWDIFNCVKFFKGWNATPSVALYLLTEFTVPSNGGLICLWRICKFTSAKNAEGGGLTIYTPARTNASLASYDLLMSSIMPTAPLRQSLSSVSSRILTSLCAHPAWSNLSSPASVLANHLALCSPLSCKCNLYWHTLCEFSLFQITWRYFGVHNLLKVVHATCWLKLHLRVITALETNNFKLARSNLPASAHTQGRGCLFLFGRPMLSYNSRDRRFRPCSNVLKKTQMTVLVCSFLDAL